MSSSSLGVVLDVLRSEGPRAVANRILDRWQEARRRRRLAPLRTGARGIEFDDAPPLILNLSPLPLAPKRGGSQIQMLDRLAAERLERVVALTYPRSGEWWLEVWEGGLGRLATFGAHSDPAEAAASAARLIGTGTVHVESLHGLPLGLILELEARGLQTVLSMHDFVLFCRRPHLIDTSTGGFCFYSRDEARCARCLQSAESGPQLSQEDYRRLGGNTIRTAGALVFPSEFLRLRHRDLFPDRRADQHEVVISPATARPQALDRRASNATRIAFVGGVLDHKGGAMIPEIMATVGERLPAAKGFVYGGGEPSLLSPMRRDRRLRIRGYYRQGRLPELLVQDRIAAAVLPSIWPETYALVVDECLSVGVPVIAFDHGAVADRLRAWGAGALVPAASGATGLADAAIDLLRNGRPVPEPVIADLPTPSDAARQHIALYRELTCDRR